MTTKFAPTKLDVAKWTGLPMCPPTLADLIAQSFVTIRAGEPGAKNVIHVTVEKGMVEFAFDMTQLEGYQAANTKLHVHIPRGVRLVGTPQRPAAIRIDVGIKGDEVVIENYGELSPYSDEIEPRMSPYGHGRPDYH